MKTAVIYARYSCDKQTEASIDGQLRVCKEYAERQKIVIVDTYIDEAISGTTDKREEFQNMIKDSYSKKWNYVLVYKLDRFSRDKYATAIYKKTLKDNGVKVLSCMENIPDTPEGIILESLLEGMNQYYSAELSQKVKRGMKELRIKGNWQGGRLPYGYRTENKKIYIKEDEAENVKYIFSQSALGVAPSKIIQNLKENFRLSDERKLNYKKIYEMLKNTKYLGWYRRSDGELVENTYPAIITQELFDSAQKKTKTSNKGTRSIRTNFLLRNKLHCGYCKATIAGDTGTSHTGAKKHYYTCVSKRRDKKHCEKKSIPQESLEQEIIRILISQLKNPNNLNCIIKEILNYQEALSSKNEELEFLLKQQKEVETAIQNIHIAIEKGFCFEETFERMKELKARKIEITKKIIKKEREKKSKLTKNDIVKYFEDALSQEPSVFLEILIYKIILYNDKKEIYFNSPLKIESPDKNQDFLFYKQIFFENQNAEIIRFFLSFIE